MSKEKPEGAGAITVIAGPMFSGKSTALLDMYTGMSERLKCQLFSSSLDTRYGEGCVATHDGRFMPAVTIATSDDIGAAIMEDTEAVFIDEPHLIKGDVAALCVSMARDGMQVVVAGLDLDYLGRPFKVMTDLMASADAVLKTHGKCAVCGGPSRYSYRKTGSSKKLLVGGDDIYEPRCRKCFPPHP